MLELNGVEWIIGSYWQVVVNLPTMGDHYITAFPHEVDMELFVWESNIKAVKFGCYFGGFLDL